MTKIALDAGHGINTAGKRTPDGEREWSFNDKVLRACEAKLNEYQDVQILRLDDSTGKTDIPLRTRTDKANVWHADVLVSIHHNAFAGAWHTGGGVETFVDNTASKASRDIAALIHPRIITAMGLRNRGLKSANFHMTRESRMPAILTEGGFMDSKTDIVAMRSAARLKAQGEAIAEGLAVYFGMQLKRPQPDDNKEVTRMFNPSSGTLKSEYETFLKQAVKDGHLSAKWLTDFNVGKLSLDDALALKVTVDNRKK